MIVYNNLKNQEYSQDKIQRRIAHLDMDAFFASVEWLKYPQLKNLAVVIGGANIEGDFNKDTPAEDFPKIKDYKGRGVVSTSTYKAREYGINSAMGIMKAAKLHPEAILLPSDFKSYKYYSNAFKEIILEIAPNYEDVGIDEVFIDFTNIKGGQRDNGAALARLIQKTIFDNTGLTCSIGVAPNKLLAKMCSEFNKPSGITIITDDDIKSKIHPLSCRKINGIGPKNDEKLKALNINTIGDLAQKELYFLTNYFGKTYGQWLYNCARGIDNRELIYERERLSISRESTFERDLSPSKDKSELSKHLNKICQQLEDDLKSKDFYTKTIGIKIKFSDFKNITREQTLENYICKKEDIIKAARECLKKINITMSIRLLGVKASSLISKNDMENKKEPYQASLPF